MIESASVLRVDRESGQLVSLLRGPFHAHTQHVQARTKEVQSQTAAITKSTNDVFEKNHVKDESTLGQKIETVGASLKKAQAMMKDEHDKQIKLLQAKDKFAHEQEEEHEKAEKVGAFFSGGGDR